MSSVEFLSVFPIGETKSNALPIQDVESALDFYTRVLGFAVSERHQETALLRRDAVTIGLAQNGDDPEQASLYFSVSDVAAWRRDLLEKGIEPSELRTDEYDGKRFRVFFAKEPYGVCFCFGQPE